MSLKMMFKSLKGGPFPFFTGSGQSISKRLIDVDNSTLKAVPLTEDEIKRFALHRRGSPVQVDGGKFARQLSNHELTHFNKYSTNYADYRRFALSTVKLRSKMAPYYQNHKDLNKLSDFGRSLVGDLIFEGGFTMYHGNGVLIGDSGVFDHYGLSKSQLVATAYHNVAQCRDENLENVCEESARDIEKCIKMYDFEVAHPEMPDEAVPARLVDYDIDSDTAILEIEKEIDFAQFMEVTKDEVFDDMVSNNKIECIMACAVNNRAQFDLSLQRSFLKDTVVGLVGDLLYGPPGFHCFIGLDREAAKSAYPSYFAGSFGFDLHGKLLEVSSESRKDVWAHQLATLAGFSGCGDSMIRNEIFGVEIRDTWDKRNNPPLWMHSNAGRIKYSRVLPIIEEYAKRKQEEKQT